MRTIIIREKDETMRRRHFVPFVFFIIAALVVLAVINLVRLANGGVVLQKELSEQLKNGFQELISGTLALTEQNPIEAQKKFTHAGIIFSQIKQATWFTFSRLPAGIMRTQQVKDPLFETSSSLVEAGQHLSNAGQRFAEVSSDLILIPKLFFEGNAQPTPQNLSSLTEKLKTKLPKITEGVLEIEKAHRAIEKVSPRFIPRDFQDQFLTAKNGLQKLNSLLNGLENDLPAVLTLLGDKEPHTILVLLQNNAELRPTGGFIGNYALLETNDGYLTKTDVYDVYQSDHQLKQKITPPDEILAINKQWYLRDSNYSAHFPLSAEKAAWFLEQEGGPGVDTIIALDQTVIAQLLELTGPIAVEGVAKPLTGENFSAVLSYMIESKLSGAQNPKQVLQKFLPAFEKTFFKNVDPVSFLPLLQKNAREKHLLAYSKDPTVQAFWRHHGLAGELSESAEKEDYLAVIHSGVAGNKSDAYITETIQHDTFLQRDGSVIDELSVTRTHGWNEKQKIQFEALATEFGLPAPNEKLLEILGGGLNYNFFRIYVPRGSSFISSEGGYITKEDETEVKLLIDQELEKSYFSAKLLIPPGQTRTLKIRYKLPYSLSYKPVDKYAVKIQKQPGQDNVTLIKRVLPEYGLTNYTYLPDSGALDADSVLTYQMPFIKDFDFVNVWGK